MSTSDEVVPSLCLEYQITVPVDVNDFQIGHLYTVSEFSKANTGGGEGVEIVVNEPRSEGKKLMASEKTSTHINYYTSSPKCQNSLPCLLHQVHWKLTRCLITPTHILLLILQTLI